MARRALVRSKYPISRAHFTYVTHVGTACRAPTQTNHIGLATAQSFLAQYHAMKTLDETLPKHERLRTQDDFQRMFDGHNSVSDRYLVLYCLPNGLQHCRVGVAAGKKLGGAVLRNRLKRMLRALYRRHKQVWSTPVDILILPRKAAPGTPYRTLVASYGALAAKYVASSQPTTAEPSA